MDKFYSELKETGIFDAKDNTIDVQEKSMRGMVWTADALVSINPQHQPAFIAGSAVTMSNKIADKDVTEMMDTAFIYHFVEELNI